MLDGEPPTAQLIFSVFALVSFLTKCCNAGNSYGTLNTLRSAISLVCGDKIGNDPLISRFFKGVYRIKPTTPKYNQTWDVSIVLKYIEEIDHSKQLSLLELSEKTIILLALSTAHRAQTLAFIKLCNIYETTKGLEIKIPELIKTSGPGSFQPLLVLHTNSENPMLCVASVILRYIEMTKSLRNNVDSLFISLKKPHKAIGPQTVSRWIKGVLTKSGIDTSVFTAHSTRHAASSAALARGIDLDTIRRTAGWSNSSQTFARFYNRPVKTDNYHFATRVVST